MIISYFNRINDQYHEHLMEERMRSERLLHNILPVSIAERLKTTGDTIADNISEASILFADIVGFTSSASRLEAELLVERLNGF